MNQMRSILLERGIVGRRKAGASCSKRSRCCCGRADRRREPRVRLLLEDMLEQWRALDERIAALDDEFAEMARNDPAARRLATIPGIGVMNATALVGGDRGCGALQPRPRPLGLARPGAASSDDRRQAEAARDHQARQ